ncbi:hypothetical protein [Mesorhizobium sp.]|uniref:hypothetical protein n=1 Tax=Mesorhizobium sp. TaxID=1871066 RepID=UPI0025EB1FE2|nr:hypothetical protein [Mesorhizobium sp.]
MLIAQDWASEDFLSKELDREQLRLGHTPSLPSNENLFRLLKTHLNTSFKETFATDAFVFVKPGNMSARIPARDLRRSALEYAMPQIEIVKPQAVVCIGSATYNALRYALKCPYASIDASLDGEPIRLESTPIFGVNHTGGLAAIFGGGPEAQERQWSRLAKAISRYG